MTASRPPLRRQSSQPIDPGRAPRLQPLCDVDPGFGQCIPEVDLVAARRYLMVPVFTVEKGPWQVPRMSRRRCACFVVLAGTLLRDARVDEQWSTELLGPEDVLQPWEELPAPLSVSVKSGWRALERSRLAVLDGRFAAAAARWPELLGELVSRGVRRSRLLAALMALFNVRRLDDRLMLFLRILAERWGRVGRDGVELELRLTHETIGRLAGARRPSVSTALIRFERDGILRRDGGRFVLPLETT
jgi:CRP/FNR family cyclic AMP-dependent transcriptional regulator